MTRTTLRQKSSEQLLHAPTVRPLTSALVASEQSNLAADRWLAIRPAAGEDLWDVVVGNVLTRIVRWIDVDEIDLADRARCLGRIHQMSDSRSAVNRRLDDDCKRAPGVGLPTLHVRSVHASGIGNTIRTLDDACQQ